jgi:hypothetical protein
MRRSLVGTGMILLLSLVSIPPAEAQPSAKRVVLFTIPGVGWQEIAQAKVPVFDELISRGATAGLVVRSATRGMAPVRGYATLGAGRRAYARVDDVDGHRLYRGDTELENGTAAEVAARRYGIKRAGSFYQTELAVLTERFTGADFGAVLGSFGEALHSDGKKTAVVAATDQDTPTTTNGMRRAVGLALADRAGMIDSGEVSDLLVEDREAPFGVRTDPRKFEDATKEALEDADVIAIDPGETLRADEYAEFAEPSFAEDQLVRAIERTDVLLGRVVRNLAEDDLLIVLAPSGPRMQETDSLTPIVAAGGGLERGWLTSPLTRRDGLVLLTDVASTALHALDVPVPDEVSDSALTVVPANNADATQRFVNADREAVFREDFVTVATVSVIALMFGLLGATFGLFMSGSRHARTAVSVLGLAVLAVPPSTVFIRMFGAWRFGAIGATFLLFGIVAVLTAATLRLRRRTIGGLVLLLLGLALAVVDLTMGAPWQLNGAFGYSPLQAGRFYGNGNLGYAVFFTTAIVGLCGLADIQGRRRAPLWLGFGLGIVLLMEGLPQFGADFGGVLAGVPAVCVVWLIARDKQLKVRTILGIGIAGVVGAAAMVGIDLLRPEASRTHLGRFAAEALNDPGGAWLTVQRKIDANVNLVFDTRWTWIVPTAIVLLLLLFWRGRGLLGGAMSNRRLLLAAIWGSLTAGIVGMFVNDSGIAIPAMVLVLTVPYFALVGLDQVESIERTPKPG